MKSTPLWFLFLSLLLTLPARAVIVDDAGGDEAYTGNLNGQDVFVGNVSVSMVAPLTPVSLGRTNGQGSPDTLPDNGSNYDVFVEVYPQQYGNQCEFTYSDDGWNSSSTIAMPYLAPQGNNDQFQGTLPGATYGIDVTVELYFTCTGPLPGDSFEIYVPGSGINFY